jgi:hypothetical protein
MIIFGKNQEGGQPMESLLQLFGPMVMFKYHMAKEAIEEAGTALNVLC